MLRSPDPVVRDGQAYSVLATWISRGVLPAEQLRELGDEMVRRFGDAEIQARTFAPLILDSIVSAGVFEPSWVPPFERWYVAEEDLRGHDAKLGWLHAVAHGADLLGTLWGCIPAVEPVQMLRLGHRPAADAHGVRVARHGGRPARLRPGRHADPAPTSADRRRRVARPGVPRDRRPAGAKDHSGGHQHHPDPAGALRVVDHGVRVPGDPRT